MAITSNGTRLQRGDCGLCQVRPQQRHGRPRVDVAHVALAPADIHLADALVAVGVVDPLHAGGQCWECHT
jgi:hypothetical protein